MAGKINSWGYQVEQASDGADALDKASRWSPQVIVSDVRMPKVDGFELIRKLTEQGGAPPVILLTQFGDIETAISAMHGAGAFWFLEKPVSLEALQVLISRAGKQRQLAEENERLRSVLLADSIGELVGKSPQMQEIFALIRQVGPSRATVFITGESGTGKELVARAIHASSPRKDHPMVAVNCAALPETLIESELFGHERGAFTGAAERRLGRIEVAHGSTLFLDEIGELPLQMQAKLLRVLEDAKVQRLGGKNEVEVDARVLAATNRNPQKAVKEGKLREDLFYRLNVVQIYLPPLRERIEDIPLIAESLLRNLAMRHGAEVKRLEPAVLEKLMAYHWPGNVRELRNVLERAVILAGEGPITTAQLSATLDMHPARLGDASQEGHRLTIPLGTSLHDAERELILATMKFTNNDRRKTAEILGLSLKTIQIKLKEYRSAETPAQE